MSRLHSDFPVEMLHSTFGKNTTSINFLEILLNESIKLNSKRLEGKEILDNKTTTKISRATTPKQLLDLLDVVEKKKQNKAKLRGFDWNRYMCEQDNVKPFVYGKLETKQTLGSILLARKLKLETF